jgi:hypothetical protein
MLLLLNVIAFDDSIATVVVPVDFLFDIVAVVTTVFMFFAVVAVRGPEFNSRFYQIF